MDKIQQNLVEHLDWKGEGKILYVGCGSATLSIRLAKTFTGAQIMGIDYWGPMWDYSEKIVTIHNLQLCDAFARLFGGNFVSIICKCLI